MENNGKMIRLGLVQVPELDPAIYLVLLLLSQVLKTDLTLNLVTEKEVQEVMAMDLILMALGWTVALELNLALDLAMKLPLQESIITLDSGLR